MERYEKYKPSGIEWIGEVPEHWDITKVKYVVKSIGSGGTPTSGNEAFYSDEGTPWVAIGDMSDTNFVFDTQKHLTKEGIDDKSLTIYPKGTLLYSIYATLGKVAVLAVPATINQAILAIVLKESYYQDFFKYNLKAMERYVFSQSNGNTQFNLSAQKVSNFEVIECPLAEQKAIAAYLDDRCADIDKVVATQEKRIALLKELKQSVITQAVTRGLNPDVKMKDSGVEWIGEVPEHWEVKKLKFSCGITDGTHFSPPTQSDGKPYITVTNVYDDIVDLENASRISEEDFLDLVKQGCQPELGDVLLAKDGTVGRTAIVSDNDCVVLSSLAILHPLFGLRSKFLKYCLDSNFLQEQMTAAMAGSALRRITITKICEFVSFVAPTEEQDAIVKYLDQRCADIDKQLKAVTKQIELLREYKQSLITEVVTGKRKVC